MFLKVTIFALTNKILPRKEGVLRKARHSQAFEVDVDLLLKYFYYQNVIEIHDHLVKKE